MNPVAKLIVGVLMTLAGISWYLFPEAITSLGFGIDPLSSLKMIISGIVGLGLIIIGIFLVWIEFEEIREGGFGSGSSKEKK